MKSRIKAHIDAGEVNVIRYVFADSLEIDPTFEKYEEAYEYCKSTQVVLEPHQECTPLRHDPSTWDEAYWRKLKMDLVKNFSDERMCHMREVAKVILAEKIQRLRAERAAEAAEAARQVQKNMPKPSIQPVATNVTNPGPSEEEEKRRIEAIRRKIEEENRKIEEQEAKFQRASNRGNTPKKSLGIAVAIGVGTAIVVTALVLALR